MVQNSCYAISLLASCAITILPANERRGIIGPSKERRLGNSPSNCDDGTIPSGPRVSFIALTTNASKIYRCTDG